MGITPTHAGWTEMTEIDQAKFEQAATRWFGRGSKELADAEVRVLKHALARTPVSHRLVHDPDKMTFGQKLADQVAKFGGSWPFIIYFGVFLALWVGSNVLLASHAFDPYPFIFLNLMLSMLAALQAPVIMMSQNRQGIKDRLAAEHDYEVNLKAEIEIMALHEKLDQMRNDQISELLKTQAEQIQLLTRLLAESDSKSASA
jgi:uncharacterized membrane protein